MRKVVAFLFLSLDGVMESPENWTPQYGNDELGREAKVGMDAADTLLFGRRTYEAFASYWPDKTAKDEPLFADWLNNTPKLVASTTLRKVEWKNSTLIKGDVVEELKRLKQRPGKNLNIIGSATLVRSLMRAEVLDELHLTIYPIIVGTGRRLFEDGVDQMPLRLLEAKTFGTGVLSLSYAPAGDEAGHALGGPTQTEARRTQ